MIIVVTGVAGAGKTTVGKRLARRLGWRYLEADAFHPPRNVRKMRGGEPLTEADRAPWLDAMAGAIREAEEDVVVSCSCLERNHRERLRVTGRDVRFVHLGVDPETAKRRVEGRAGHFFGPALVESQFQALEPPDRGVTVDAGRPPDAIVEEVVRRLSLEDADDG